MRLVVTHRGSQMRLRRVLCASLIIAPPLAIVSISHAQTPLPRRLGLTGGINSASFGGTDPNAPPPERHRGFVGGALLVVPINRRVGFEPELLYTMKGAESTNQAGTGAFKLNYVELPLLVRYEVEPSSGFRPFFVAGPGIALKTSCTIEATTFGSSQSSSCADLAAQTGSNVAFRSLDYGLIFGGGFAFDVYGKTLTGGGRYNYGLARIADSSPTKNRVFSLLTTIEFPLSRR